ncbi:MAG: hypothetical protein LKM32_04605 [Chiayiivirga sp.]|jgi:hypothetical protein|uniref:hypothetical protein n=1 Tax=Chiayiivirga sp. TaxID=2041042 RepID=UPI0025C62426|nr:hypothetical protein [Chiayiivirga sp.]MCI1710492.1 hypothetical protein [Chiayiivirga sp.]MCI1728695.1 hypothetical protein [Chiayiivirga sp.]
MTAEIAILNNHGVALAADSAVTLGQDATKIYTSADKLFQLHNSDPVGVMIYGNANIVGVPWETVIKAFRSEVGSASHGTLKEYADQFLDYISAKPEIFSLARERRHVQMLIGSLFMHIRNELAQRIDEVAAEQDGLDDQALHDICVEHFNKRLEIVKSQYLLERQGSGVLREIRKKHSKEILDVRKSVFGDMPFGRKGATALSAIAVEMLGRNYFGPLTCGVVFAGFGRSQYLPELISYDIEEFVLGKPRISKPVVRSISDDNSGFLVPFAQQEMVHAFMNGADPDLMSHIVSSTTSLFSGAMAALIELVKQKDTSLGTEIQKRLVPAQKSLLDNLVSDWNKKTEGFWQPVLQIVASLPKDELAAMAEALVNLTKFRRRVTTTRETVGGPIDVAVITKGDGFVWVKRKHYFSADLNPRVMSRYFKG